MNILFICTHNRCRSILSEAITNSLSDGRIYAYSAGSQPADEVHPLTLKYLREKHIPVEGLSSKSWDDMNIFPDIVITVCDSAANESCPIWLGNANKVHWGLPDPSKLQSSEDETKKAFFSVMDIIEQRVKKLLALPVETMSKETLQAELTALAGEK